MSVNCRTLVRSAVMVLAVLVLAGGVWGAVWWARYPKVPDVARADVRDAITFIGTDDFNRMTEAHRRRYVLACADRLKEKSFGDLLGLAVSMGPGGRPVAENINRMRDKDEVGGAFLRVGLDKFFELPKDQRDMYFTMWAMAEKFGGGAGRGPFGPPGRGAADGPTTNPAGPGGATAAGGPKRGAPPRVPTPDQLEKGMAKFLGNQPPRTAAQMSEMMSAMRKKRAAMGIKEG